jgi:hypothetical protein
LGVHPASGTGEDHQSLVAKSAINAIGFCYLVVGLTLQHHVAKRLHLITLPIPLTTVCRQGICWLLKFAAVRYNSQMVRIKELEANTVDC